jgi:type II secretory ATPase GspE/PulE/Tfp pilus assembly ATPase PilB-like protein
LLLAELLLASPTELGRAILSREDAARLEELAQAAGLVPIATQAAAAVRDGFTSDAELLRILGSRGIARTVVPRSPGADG